MKKSLQIRLDTNSTHPLIKEWVANQGGSHNAALKEVLMYFIRVYGTNDINSLETKAKMNLHELNVSGLLSDNEYTNKMMSVAKSSPQKNNQDSSHSINKIEVTEDTNVINKDIPESSTSDSITDQYKEEPAKAKNEASFSSPSDKSDMNTVGRKTTKPVDRSKRKINF